MFFVAILFSVFYAHEITTNALALVRRNLSLKIEQATLITLNGRAF